MLPETVSQLLSWFASFWLEMVTLIAEGASGLTGLFTPDLDSVQGGITLSNLDSLTTGRGYRNASGDCVAASQLVRIVLARDGHTA
jgi:hypothetical protein